jgi:hypothetical protein
LHGCGTLSLCFTNMPRAYGILHSALQGGQWFHYDDSFVQPTKLETVVRRCEADGYLFFYINSAILGPTSKQQQQQQAQ